MNIKTLQDIKKPVASEIKGFQKHFHESVKSDIPFLKLIINYILRSKGKQIRPLYIFLTARMMGQVNHSTYVAASLIELLHTATLVHDDVVDDSYERRGQFSIYALWNSKVAVLLGDYLLAKGLLLSMNENEIDLLKIVSNAVQKISEGELIQIKQSRKLEITEEQYFNIISKKTASLFSACTCCAGKSVNAKDEEMAKLEEFGMNAGIIFQIKDDISDYQKKGLLGKPTGNDIKEKKLTLPLIYALNSCKDQEKNKIIKIIKSGKNKRIYLDEIIHFVNKYKGIEYANEVMLQYKEKTFALLDSFPSNEYNLALRDLLDYCAYRNK
jgi:octaprenyl-diphosphate synthase